MLLVRKDKSKTLNVRFLGDSRARNLQDTMAEYLKTLKNQSENAAIGELLNPMLWNGGRMISNFQWNTPTYKAGINLNATTLHYVAKS